MNMISIRDLSKGVKGMARREEPYLQCIVALSGGSFFFCENNPFPKKLAWSISSFFAAVQSSLPWRNKKQTEYTAIISLFILQGPCQLTMSLRRRPPFLPTTWALGNLLLVFLCKSCCWKLKALEQFSQQMRIGLELKNKPTLPLKFLNASTVNKYETFQRCGGLLCSF